MDSVQLVLLWCLVVACNTQQIPATLVHFTEHADRLHLLQRVERRVAEQRHRKMHQPHRVTPSPHDEITPLRNPECGRNHEETLSCPWSGKDGPCLKLSDLCDNRRNCPHAEDEDPVSCLFFRMTKHFVTSSTDKAKAVAKHHRSGD